MDLVALLYLNKGIEFSKKSYSVIAHGSTMTIPDNLYTISDLNTIPDSHMPPPVKDFVRLLREVMLVSDEVATDCIEKYKRENGHSIDTSIATQHIYILYILYTINFIIS